MKIPLFLKALNSPFKPFKLKWYFGKVAVPTPCFLPRTWVKFTWKDCLEKARETINKRPNIYSNMSVEAIANQYKDYRRAIPKKVGFDFIDLIWKTKWTRTDYRHEFSPVWSFVFFGYQIAINFIAPHYLHYWEVFLYYYFETDKNKSRRERIEQCRKDNPCVWTSIKDGVKETVDYYELVIKERYLSA